MTFNRLTIDDLINLKRKDCDIKADVNIGDLVKIDIDGNEILGIVLHVDDKSMKIQTPSGEVKWMSLYVKCIVI